ncbi:zinc finger protein 41 homolog [Poeciliopsis prolifica]|uniref:zinc finger protein 41 homolog n=1 Tax=Poeciliopsis prolifica TaxID=188132 RepID=UPI00241375A2|nr:zinc finger protein 41 homolog [Poeciliopsis prolifica]
MCSVEPLREFIRERLTAAAEEIFTQLEKTIVRYEEEIDRQRRLLDLSWTRTEQNPADVQRRLLSRKQQVLMAPLLSNHETLSGPAEPEPETVDRDPECVRVKEEPDDEIAGRDEEQLRLKQEADSFTVSPAEEDGEDSNLDPVPSEPGPSEPGAGAQDEEPEASSHDELSRDEQSGKRAEPKLRQTPFSCKMCSKSFRQKGSLTKHLRLHAGGNPFTCASCGRSFRKHFSLIVHMRIHTGEKPFPCLVCGKSFCQRGNLNVHMRTHTGEKPFPCLTCGKHFQRKSNLTAHTRIHKRNAVRFHGGYEGGLTGGGETDALPISNMAALRRRGVPAAVSSSSLLLC